MRDMARAAELRACRDAGGKSIASCGLVRQNRRTRGTREICPRVAKPER